MVSRLLRISACAMFVLFGSANLFAASSACDRACLKSALETYLNAVIKHDPAAAQLWLGYRQTENAVLVQPGNGVWKTVTGLGKIQRRYADPVTQQVGYFGEIMEGDTADIVTVRLRIEDRKVAEGEWIIARPNPPGAPPAPGGANPKGLEDHAPPPDQSLPKSARSSREAMLAAVNSYFDGLQAHDGSGVMSKPGCPRVENGGVVTGVGPGRGGGPVEDRGDCAAHYEQMTMLAVTARRYPIVDEEAGVVLGMVLFIRPPGAMQRRNLLSEWFPIENNKITGIYASMFYPEPQQPVPNWPPFEGNWPLPATLPGMTPPPPPAAH